MNILEEEEEFQQEEEKIDYSKYAELTILQSASVSEGTLTINKVILFYIYFKEIMSLKCKIMREILETYRNGKDFLLDYV